MVVSGLPKPNEGRHIAEICSMALCVRSSKPNVLCDGKTTNFSSQFPYIL